MIGQKNPDLFARGLKDYARVGRDLMVQRLIIFTAAISLAAYYYDTTLAMFCLSLVAMSEVYDNVVVRRILAWDGEDPRQARRFQLQIFFGTTISAGVISLFAVSIALQQGPTTHFMPLFLLFAAALFAAMNNHQLLPVLILRLSIYGGTFLFIPIWDLVQVRPPMHSELWLQFFTILFVLYFILDCSRIFMTLYLENVRKILALKREHTRTKDALRVKSEFVSTVSHELRTPITSIKGSLDIVNAGVLGPVPEKMTRVLDIAKENSDRLASLINDLLDFQKMESGKMEYKFEPVRIGELLQETVDRTRPFAENFSVEIETEGLEAPIFIQADKARIEQVVTNLLSNAAKFSHSGGKVSVTLDLVDDRVRISIADRGIGLPMDAKDKVFGAFVQMDSSKARRQGGTGLGMNISKRIIEAHGGTIDYDSTIGEGSTFYIDLDRIALNTNETAARKRRTAVTRPLPEPSKTRRAQAG